ncbi:MAG: hypothetical protein HY429_04495 [Candidatus Levybacteria bacterium]|nr:hypothetical protein [Candidatus Levybacteria bacterium]
MKGKVSIVSPESLGEDLALVTKGVIKAGNYARAKWGFDRAMHAKGINEGIVTKTDMEVNSLIIDFLQKNFPNDRILTEESYLEGTRVGNSYFIVDPIDGSNHFARGLHDWAIVVARVINRKIDSGVVFAPTVQELYYTKQGKGAYKNGVRMSVSTRELIGVQIGHDVVRYFGRTDIEERAIKLSQMHWVTGSTQLALARLANGQIELAINMGQPIWDFAAGKLMIEEAGGKFTDFNGNTEFDISGRKTNNFVASSSLHHRQGMRIVKGL